MADPKLNELTNEAKGLNKELSNLKKLLGEFGTSTGQFKNAFNTVTSSLKSTSQAAKETTASTQGSPSQSTTSSGKPALGSVSKIDSVWSKGKAALAGFDAGATARQEGGSWGQAAGAARNAASYSHLPPPPAGGGGGGMFGGGGGGGISSMLSGGGGGGIGAAINLVKKASDVYGSITAGGLQFAYNRIEGPTGNRNAVLGLAQALSPNAGMMGMSTEGLLTGLAQRTPVLGSNQDIVSTILSGQSVGAFMNGSKASKESGIPGRSGFFESVRQAQLLTPGVGAGQIASTISNYIGNTQSQQMGQYLGQGAFTMVGKGGSYKSLAEWAESILKFLSEQRPGKAQGSKFGKDELMSQNFPGSNINAWFRMMGVPQDMVDYWWQYALANAGQTNPITQQLLSKGNDSQTEVMQANIDRVRGKDLGYERLRSVTQGTRRDYLMGTQMYGMYNARESADRRFNVGMQAADLTIGNLARTTNAGAAMALFPTPIMEMLMPIITKLASSPIGTALSGIGNIQSLISGLNPFGDPIGDPVGDYGPTGSTSTRHLSPDLAKKVNAMMSANPRLKISSGYRDTVTQNRLHSKGVGRVGPASKSAHTRGWAADIGPTSELGWVQANAGKFGLQTAANAGEPWHVQSEGTMPVGDIFSGLMGGLTDMASMSVLGPFQNMVSGGLDGGSGGLSSLLKNFISGGNLSDLIDNAISMFIKLMTAPLSGLANVFGKLNMSKNDLNNLIDKPSSVKVNVSKYAGFTPSTNEAITGKNAPPIFGDPISMASQTAPTIHARMDSPIIFKTEITLSGSAGNSPVDAQRAATTIADHLESELARRAWRKS